MTAEELARAILARRRSRRGEAPGIPWDALPHDARQRLVASAERLAASWRTDRDPPSRGISSPDD